MSWLKIDDGFEDHPKVAPLSDAAHRLWTRAACWCQKTGSDGFVPRPMLAAISKHAAPLKRLEKLAQELVEANAGGVFESGLWEIVEGGWQFHDWGDYQPAGNKHEEDKHEPMSRSAAARAAGIRSAQVRRERHGTAQPVLGARSERTSPERPPNDVRESFESRSTEHRSETFDRTTFERLPNDVRTPDPDPRSDLPKADNTHSRPDRLEQPEPPAAALCGKPKHVARFEKSFEAIAKDSPAASMFRVYCQLTGKAGLRYDHKAEELFEQLVVDGETVESVAEVVRGALLTGWARDTAKLAATAILGSSQQRERFRAVARDPPPERASGRRRAPVQPNDPTNRFIPRDIA